VGRNSFENNFDNYLSSYSLRVISLKDNARVYSAPARLTRR